MEIKEETTIGEIVAKDYRTASVFESLGIDYCCNGNQAINEVCESRGIDYSDLITNINSIKIEPKVTKDYDSWRLDKLASHIEKKHHKYIEKKIPLIKQYLDKVCKVHGKQHPELFKVQELFNVSAGELTMHMKKEELILFPFIKKIAKLRDRTSKVTRPNFETVRTPIQAMMNEHTNEGERFQKINELTQNYKLPNDACRTYEVCFNYLKEFAEDLHLHIHLENNILFPKAIELEKDFK